MSQEIDFFKDNPVVPFRMSKEEERGLIKSKMNDPFWKKVEKIGNEVLNSDPTKKASNSLKKLLNQKGR